MEIIFATHNPHKLQEVAALLRPCDRIIAPDFYGFTAPIPETQSTIEGNSLQKAQYIYDKLHKPVFADDTGLEVIALKGAPGVYSARYAGLNCSFEDNINKLLAAMDGIEDRRACFRTVVTLILADEVHQFVGRVDGEILISRQGAQGFGYDPIFRPVGSQVSFAQMPLDAKNTISHRGRAITQMVGYLNRISPCD